MASSNFLVVADTREKPEYRWMWDEQESCGGTIVRKLDTGDYSIAGMENIVAIDRKATTGELAGNMVEKRFKDVLERLSCIKHSFIICEFGYKEVLDFPADSGIPKYKWPSLKVTPKWMMRYISEIQVNYGVQIIMAGNTYNAKYCCYNILKRVYEQNKTN